MLALIRSSTRSPPYEAFLGRPTPEFAFLRQTRRAAKGSRRGEHGLRRVAPSRPFALGPAASPVGHSPRTRAGANQLARYLPPAPATCGADEVLRPVPGQYSERAPGQRSLRGPPPGPGARKEARRPGGSRTPESPPARSR